MFNKYIPHLIVLFLLIITSLIIYIIFTTDINKVFGTNANTNTNTEKICLSIPEYNKLLSKNNCSIEKYRGR